MWVLHELITVCLSLCSTYEWAGGLMFHDVQSLASAALLPLTTLPQEACVPSRDLDRVAVLGLGKLP